MTGTLWLLILGTMVVTIAAANWWLGMWSNLVTFVNVLLSGLIATSFYHIAANHFIMLDSSWIHVIDFTMIWFLFAGSFVGLRSLTELFSRYRMRFHPLLEVVGRSVGCVANGVLFVCFACFTLLFAPMSLDDAAAFQDKGLYPESAWAALVDLLSQSSLEAHGQSAWFGNTATPNRPMGSVDLYQTMGDALRKSVSESTNLRIVKPRF